MDAAARRELEASGVIHRPSDYGGDPYPITMKLVEDGRRRLRLRAPIPFAGPVRLLHGQRDPDVPWERSLLLAGCLAGDDVRCILVKDGDHRLSRARDLELLAATLDELLG